MKKKNKKEKESNYTMLELHNMRINNIFKQSLKNKKDKLAKLNGDKKLKLEKEIKEIEKKQEEEFSEYLLDIVGVLKYKNQVEKEEAILSKERENEEVSSLDKIMNRSEDTTKTRILNQYLISTRGVGILNEEEKNYYKNLFQCKNCDSEDIIRCKKSSSIICKICGYTTQWADIDQPEYSKTSSPTRTYRYRPDWYFMEHLNRFQAIESVEIKDELIENIYEKLNEQRIYDKKMITYDVLREILKSLKQSKFYDNINKIKKIITGDKAPRFSAKVVRKLQKMFSMTLDPYNKWKHLIKHRNNYLYYHYVIRNLVIILSKNGHPEIDKYKNKFKKLVDPDKIIEQEKVWEKICEECGWPFYESITYNS